MKQPTFCGRELLPLSVIEAVRVGDPLAVESVLRYYDGYMNKLCTRTLYDLNSLPHVRVDEYMKHRFNNLYPVIIVVQTRYVKHGLTLLNTTMILSLMHILTCACRYPCLQLENT